MRGPLEYRRTARYLSCMNSTPKRSLLLALAIVLVGAVGLAPTPASAKSSCDKSCRIARRACRKTCKANRRTCRQAARTKFVTDRAACKALSTRPERRGCMRTARRDRRTARRACNVTFKQCKLACKQNAGGGGGGGNGGGGNGGGGGGQACQAPTSNDWLARANLHRSVAGLPAVTENPVLSAGDQRHAEYLVKTDTVVHAEDPSSPFYTAEGDAAGQSSNVAGSSSPTASPASFVDMWMQGPFHAIGILDPKLAEVGFGIAHDDSGPVKSGAALDVINGRTGSPNPSMFPIFYPADGQALPIDRYPGNEIPDPLTACTGYTAPSGPPLMVQFQSAAPAVTDHTLLEDGVAVDNCVYDGTTYTNPDPQMQDLGQNVLAGRNAVVMIPRNPLKPGSQYEAILTFGTQVLDWTFTVACQ